MWRWVFVALPWSMVGVGHDTALHCGVFPIHLPSSPQTKTPISVRVCPVSQTNCVVHPTFRQSVVDWPWSKGPNVGHVTGQLCVLQYWFILVEPLQVFPPFAGDGLEHDLVDDWVPVPQVTVHVDQPLQFVQPPFTGHALVLQYLDVPDEPLHPVPPLEG